MNLESFAPYAPFGLLAVALLVFLLSTRQFPLALRGLIWSIGAAALAAAGWFALRDQYPGAFGLVADAFRGNPLDSALLATLSGNLQRVVTNLSSMFAIFFVMALALAILALISFTRGERLEQALRPIIYATLGAIGGGFLALTIVALGLGGYQKDRTYAARGEAVEIIDGDTIRMGDVSLRLWGIDAPEHDQVCLTNFKDGLPTHPTCADKATAHLKALLAGAYIVCGPPPGRTRLQETFGRPLVTCHAYGKGVQDIATQMAKDGFADVYRQDGRTIVSSYCSAVKTARARNLGIWREGFLYPWQWRNDPDARASFFELQQVAMVDVQLDQCAQSAVAAAKKQ